MLKLKTPVSEDDLRKLRAGDKVELTGVLYTARDAAHKRLLETLERGEELPVDLRGQIVYYVGPCPARPGQVIGSAGPTTSGRMDPYTPAVISKMGLRGMIGKGSRSRAVVESMIEYGAVYFLAIGGAGALLAKRIVKSEVVAYEDLGTEAIRRIEVVDFPVVVGIDSEGRDIYEEGKAKYRIVQGG